MMKLLLLSNMGPSKQKPNSGRFVYNQYEALAKRGEMDVDYYYLTQDEKGKFARLFRYPIFFFRFLLKYLFSKKVDIIHVHFFYPTIFLAIAYKLLRNRQVKLITTFHGSDVYHYQVPSKLYRWCFTQVDHAIFVSASLLKSFESNISTKEKKVSILSAGILDTYHPASHVTPKYDFIFVGHLDKNKGFDRLQKIANKGVKIAIVGQGNPSQLLSQNGNICADFHGVLPPEQLAKLYCNSRFLLSLSRNESFGLVITEAMASGVPVLATRTDGASVQIEHGVNGFLLENSDSWLEECGYEYVLSKLKLNENAYAALQREAIKTASEHRLDKVINRLIELYCELLVKG